jgi:hypothetical protein
MKRIFALAILCLSLSGCAIVDLACQATAHEHCAWQK